MSRRGQGTAGYGPALVLAVAVGAPLLLASGLVLRALAVSPLESAAPVDPLQGTVESASRSDSAAVQVQIRSGEPFPVTSQSDGVITELGIVTGSALSSGQVAMEVSGLPVIAYVSDTPLYRDITTGMEGDDVRIAQQLLADTGYLRSPDGFARAATGSAITRFNREHGRAADGSTLRLSSLLWAPSDGATAEQLSVRVGTVISSGDELYMAGAGTPTVTISGEPSDAERILTVGSAAVVVHAGGTVVTDVAAVEAVRDSLGEEQSGAGTVRLREPRQVGTVPASAVVSDSRGLTCFFPDVDGTPVVIDASQGQMGGVDVSLDLVGDPILINPREVREDRSCE